MGEHLFMFTIGQVVIKKASRLKPIDILKKVLIYPNNSIKF